MKNIVTKYRVMDAVGLYGTYKDRMQAIMKCNKLCQDGDEFVQLIEVVEREIDWLKDYEELYSGQHI
jgi:hypothetical protein